MLEQRLKAARKAKKLTQEELAKILKTTKGTISNYENGHSTPSNEMLILLSDALDCSTDYLLGKTNVVKPNQSTQTDLKAWLRQANSDLSEDEKDELSDDLEKYLAFRKQRILEKRKGNK